MNRSRRTIGHAPRGRGARAGLAGSGQALLVLAGVLAALALSGLIAAPAVRAQSGAPATETPARLDLNRATLAEIQKLPIPAEVARAIWDYRTHVRFFRSIYDVAEVPGVTPEILATLRPLVATQPPETKDETFRRYDAAFRQIQQFLSEEGAREETADEYLDMLRDPRNVNRLNLFDLMSFQNVSPVDAVAILKARERAGQIENERQLRSSDGLSYWGYRNLRDYMVYEDPVAKGELHGDLQLLAYDTPYVLDAKDVLTEPLPGTPRGNLDRGTAWGIMGLDQPNPAVGTKLRLRLGSNWRGGLMTYRNVGEQYLDETVKGFAAWRNPRSRGIDLDRAVLGNFRVAFGQGLVMDNTDYFVARKNGYGYNVRPRSVLGDLGRSHEFALRGLAVEGHAGPMRGVGFVSQDRKDGLLNPDGSLNKYVVMGPRLENSDLSAMRDTIGMLGLRQNAFRETIYGGNLLGQLWTGTYVGVSGYEARYDEAWNPMIGSIVPPGRNGQDLLEARDRELFSAYNSQDLGKFRRVVGAEFQTVYQNVALQGEYAKLDANPKNGLDGLLSAAPEAYSLNAYVQYEDLNLQLLWRDYDVGFDNPYARGFSEASRYDQSLLGDPYRLQNPLLSWIALNTPQMKSERGLFANLRYRVTRNFTIAGLEYDQWRREADGQDARRWVARLEYTPIFPLRFRLRQRYSSRGEMVDEDFRHFRGWDTRLEMQARLSGYDELRFLYSTSKTEFAPRPRLVGEAEPLPTGAYSQNPLGQASSPAQGLQAVLTHNVNDRLQFVFSSEIYDGFLYNFEDNEFVVLDENGFRNWFLVRSRFSDSMMMRFKLTHDRALTRSNVDIRQYMAEFGFPNEGDNTRGTRTSFRLQLDYTF